MEANKTPEKVYLTPLMLFAAPTIRSSINDIEYVRKDAFIEKAENFLEMLGYGFTITDNITHANYDKEQLIEDFRKYVKGE